MSSSASPDRPDPDALLARLREAESRAGRGQLKIFLGACPGVGKTYSMLTNALRLRGIGVDVVCGLVETHGRAETAQLAAALEILPRRGVEAGGRRREEFDLDAALARRPEVLLIDELAHANAPGSRHPKRWQDVEELLAAGIEVHSTLNVQHLESLNDIVSSIIGVRVRETVPDRVFDQADEVVLVDLPAEDLLQRLREGKVYVPQEAERAAKNFFRRGNLLALRELALRRTADRVDDQMRHYRREHVGGKVWNAEEAVLVCIGPAAGGERLVRSGARLAAAFASRWHALYVETPVLQRLDPSRRATILATLKLAEDMGAVTATVAAQDPAAAAVEYARAHNLGRIVAGRRTGRWSGWRGGMRFAERVARAAPEIDLLTIPADAEGKPPQRAGPPAAPVRLAWRSHLAAVGITAVTTLVATPFADRLEPTNLVMFFLLAVVITAALLGRGPAVLGAVLNVVAFDFFFVPPRFSFSVSDVEYLVTFAVLLIVGLVIAELTARLRYQARVATYREERANSLYELARDLSSALGVEQVAATADRYLERMFRAKAAMLVLDESDRLGPGSAGVGADPQIDMAIARWCLDHVQPAGIGTDTLPAVPLLYLPLKAPMRTRGVLVIEPGNPRLLQIPEQRRLLETVAALSAIGLERVHYVAVAQRTLVGIESERLRNSLLSALSHDLRTPLTALLGAADTLAMRLGAADPEARALAVSMADQVRRMSQLVGNLLDMARLQSGPVQLRKDWQSLEEMVGSALKSLEAVIGARPVAIDLPGELPLIHCDALLIERVLSNLIENALKFTPAGTPIGVSARIEGGAAEITVWDRGPGIPDGQEERIFEKFARGDRESAIPGVGLGLAICRAIVQAHGGRIAAHRHPGGGAAFTFTLPLEKVPDVFLDSVSA